MKASTVVFLTASAICCIVGVKAAPLPTFGEEIRDGSQSKGKGIVRPRKLESEYEQNPRAIKALEKYHMLDEESRKAFNAQRSRRALSRWQRLKEDDPAEFGRRKLDINEKKRARRAQARALVAQYGDKAPKEPKAEKRIRVRQIPTTDEGWRKLSASTRMNIRGGRKWMQENEPEEYKALLEEKRKLENARMEVLKDQVAIAKARAAAAGQSSRSLIEAPSSSRAVASHQDRTVSTDPVPHSSSSHFSSPNQEEEAAHALLSFRKGDAAGL